MPLEILAKTILNKKKKPDEWFLDDYTLNPYSGCSFNCVYCYIRGSKYGIHMEEKLAVKTNAPELLEKQLQNLAKKNKYGVIVLASATDPYLQVEKDIGLTRKLLEVIRKYRFPVHIITKSDLVVRDFDLLHEINNNAILPLNLQGKINQGVFVTFSFSTIEDIVAKIFEPGATLPSVRLETLKQTAAAGFHCGVSMMPLLSFISDTEEEMDKMFGAFKAAGAKYVFPASLTLFGEGPADSKTLMFRAIEKYYPHLLDNYKNLFANDFRIASDYQRKLSEKTNRLLKKHGIKNRII
jgi:DNA repair photolyase